MNEKVRTAFHKYSLDKPRIKASAEDLLARNLVIIGLDRFCDFMGHKSDIIVRETSA
jgi:hypothetical protein